MEKIAVMLGKNQVLDGYVGVGSTDAVFYGKGDIANFLGFAKNWYGRNVNKDTKAGRFLASAGYEAEEVSVMIPREGKRGATRLQLINGSQLDLLVGAAAMAGKKDAIATLVASFREVRISRERDALGLEPLRMDEKQESFDEYRSRYYKWFAANLSDAEWKAGDAIAPTVRNAAVLSESLKQVYNTAPKYVVEKSDQVVDYDEMMAEYEPA